jgi:hypothetical protein
MTIDDPAEVPAESESAPPPLTPEARARPTLRGEIEVEVFGHRWTLADYMPGGHPVWDEIFDLGNLAGKYPPDRLRLAAFHLLWANYDLTADEGAAIILCVPSPELVAPPAHVSHRSNTRSHREGHHRWRRRNCTSGFPASHSPMGFPRRPSRSTR